MTPNLVSVGLPVFNGEAYLAEALDSLLAQSFTDFELIISDNASTDRTQSICESRRQRDPRIRYFRQPVNQGPSSNFNFVLRQATGKYFMWAAHDDFWDRDWIATLLRNFSAGTAISFGHVVLIAPGGQIILTHGDLAFTGSRLSRLVRYFLADEHDGKVNLIYGLYLTDLIRDVGFTTYNGCEFGHDLHVVFDCLQRGVIRTDPAVRLYKRVANPSPAAFSLRKFISSLFLLDWIRNYANYIFIAHRGLDKAALAALLPVKYLSAGVLNVYYGLKLRLGLLFERNPLR